MAEDLIPHNETEEGAVIVAITPDAVKNDHTSAPKANANFVTPVTNGTAEVKGKNWPTKVTGPDKIVAGEEVTYVVDSYNEKNKDTLKKDKEKTNWVFWIEGVTIQPKRIQIDKKRSENTDSKKDFMDEKKPKILFEAIKNKGYLYAKVDGTKDKPELKIKFSKWLDGKEIHVEAFRNKPGLKKGSAVVVSKKIEAKPEIIDIEWVNNKKLPLKFSDYKQDKFLKIRSLGLKDKQIELELQDYQQAIGKQTIPYTATQNQKSVTIKGRNTLKKIKVLGTKNENNTGEDEIVFSVDNTDQPFLPQLQLQALITQGELVNQGAEQGKLIFAKFLDVYPTEKIIDTYFAKKEKVTVFGEGDTSSEEIVYKPVKELSIGQKTYLVANGANLGNKTIKLKIHEKAAPKEFKILTSQDDYLKVCKPKGDKDKDFTELTDAEGYIEAKVDKNTNQAVAELVMRPKTTAIATEGEEAVLSLEGWKEALYHREDEEPTYVSPSTNRPAHTALTYDANVARKSYPQKVSVSGETTAGKDISFECTFKSSADANDKKNVRWCIYIKDVHDKFGKVKKIAKDSNNKDIDHTEEQNNYTIITDRSEIADTDTDFLTNATKANFDSKSYLYARVEIIGGKSKLTIQFSKQLVGKTIQIEAFRGNPNLSGNRGYIKPFTLKEEKKAKLLKRLTTNLFVEAVCEETKEVERIELINKKEITEFNSNPIWYEPIDNGEITLYSFGNKYGTVYKPRGSSFGAVRTKLKNNKAVPKNHTGLDVFAENGTVIKACLDGVVERIYGSDNDKSYGKVLVIEVKSTEDFILCKNNYKLKYKGEIEKHSSFNTKGKIYLRYAHLQKIDVKVGDFVLAGDPVGLSGVTGNASGTRAPHLHFEIANLPRPNRGLVNRCNPAFYVNIIPEEKANKEHQEKVSKTRHYI